MTLRQVEVHEIYAESDYDEDDDGPVAGADGSLSQVLNLKEPFENLPRPSSHHSVPQHEIHADDYDEDGDGQSREVKQPFGNLPRLHHSEHPFDGHTQYQDEPDDDIEVRDHLQPVRRRPLERNCRRRSLDIVLVTLVLVANRTIVHMSTQTTLYGARATNSHDSRRGV